MSALEVVNGHELIEMDEQIGGFTCKRCGQHRPSAVAFELTTARCPFADAVEVRVIEPPAPRHDKIGRELTWATTAELLGGHVHVTIRHGVAGQRALCGTLIVGADDWPDLRAVLSVLGMILEDVEQ